MKGATRGGAGVDGGGPGGSGGGCGAVVSRKLPSKVASPPTVPIHSVPLTPYVGHGSKHADPATALPGEAGGTVPLPLPHSALPPSTTLRRSTPSRSTMVSAMATATAAYVTYSTHRVVEASNVSSRMVGTMSRRVHAGPARRLLILLLLLLRAVLVVPHGIGSHSDDGRAMAAVAAEDDVAAAVRGSGGGGTPAVGSRGGTTSARAFMLCARVGGGRWQVDFGDGSDGRVKLEEGAKFRLRRAVRRRQQVAGFSDVSEYRCVTASGCDTAALSYDQVAAAWAAVVADFSDATTGG